LLTKHFAMSIVNNCVVWLPLSTPKIGQYSHIEFTTEKKIGSVTIVRLLKVSVLGL